MNFVLISGLNILLYIIKDWKILYSHTFIEVIEAALILVEDFT